MNNSKILMMKANEATTARVEKCDMTSTSSMEEPSQSYDFDFTDDDDFRDDIFECSSPPPPPFTCYRNDIVTQSSSDAAAADAPTIDELLTEEHGTSDNTLPPLPVPQTDSPSVPESRDVNRVVANDSLTVAGGFNYLQCFESMMQSEVKTTANLSVLPLAYIRYRRYVIDWTFEVGEDLLLSKSSIHTACLYLDTILRHYVRIPSKVDLKMLSLSSLHLACKVSDAEEILPTYESLSTYVKDHDVFSKKHVAELEKRILQSMGWDIMLVTPVHFLGLFLQHSVLEDTVRSCNDNPMLFDYFKSYCEFFADLAVQNAGITKTFVPSVLAVAILQVVRRSLELNNNGNDEIFKSVLYEMTGYDVDSLTIQDCALRLWNLFKETFPDHQPTGSSNSSTSTNSTDTRYAGEATASHYTSPEDSPCSVFRFPI